MKAFYQDWTYDLGIPIKIFKTSNLGYLAHWHIDYEMAYVYEGSICVGINKEQHTLNEGDMAIFSSSDIHYYDSEKIDSKLIIAIFHPDLVGSSDGFPKHLLISSLIINQELIANMGLDMYIMEKIKEIFFDILREAEERNMYCELSIKSNMLELFSMILRSFPSHVTCHKEKYSENSTLKPMQKALLFIETNYMHDITQESLAKKVNLSTSYFSRLFREICGMNFNKYLNSIRVDKAESLIKSCSKPIIDIAAECGFSSIRTFNRSFKTIKGFPPSYLRKNIK